MIGGWKMLPPTPADPERNGGISRRIKINVLMTPFVHSIILLHANRGLSSVINPTRNFNSYKKGSRHRNVTKNVIETSYHYSFHLRQCFYRAQRTLKNWLIVISGWLIFNRLKLLNIIIFIFYWIIQLNGRRDSIATI